MDTIPFLTKTLYLHILHIYEHGICAAHTQTSYQCTLWYGFEQTFGATYTNLL